MVNLITRMISMEIVWIQCESDTFYGNFKV